MKILLRHDHSVKELFQDLGKNSIREEAPQKMSKKMGKVQKGGGSHHQKSKSPQFKLWTTLRRSGGPRFAQIQMTESWS